MEFCSFFSASFHSSGLFPAIANPIMIPNCCSVIASVSPFYSFFSIYVDKWCLGFSDCFAIGWMAEILSCSIVDFRSAEIVRTLL
jgi:hypothetical protein